MTGDRTVPTPAGPKAHPPPSGSRRQRPARPTHLSAGNIALVAGGGAVGTALRYVVTVLVPPAAGLPVAIFTVNVVGAFVLGVLLELLAEWGPDVGWSRRLRLGIGTGVLGGFTTYSSLAADSVTVGLAHPGLAIGYGVGTVVIGGAAAWLGIAVSRHRLRPAARARPTAAP